jgi:membrane-associated PAP2 superfamily phosphatase
MKEPINSSTVAASPTPAAERPSLLWPAVAVAATLGFFGFAGTGGERLDLWFQGLFWNGTSWLVPHEAKWGRVLAYDGPKALIIAFALVSLVLAIKAMVQGRVSRLHWFNLACLAAVSVLCTQLRAVSHMATPLDLKLYGGAWEHLLLFQPKPALYPSHAFPAGHASGGFALICLYWSLPAAHRRAGLAVGLGLGAWMGLYQIARGEHFLSHTLATAALAWLVCALLVRWIRPQPDLAA